MTEKGQSYIQEIIGMINAIFCNIARTIFDFSHNVLVMKYAFLILLLFVSIYMFPGCKCQCQDGPYSPYSLQFPNVNDSSATLTIAAYSKGSNFSTVIKNDTTIPLRFGSAFYYSLDFSFDYLLTVSPTGKIYKLTKLAWGNASQSMGFTGDCGEPCYNGVSYSVNDSTYYTEPTSSSGPNSITIN